MPVYIRSGELDIPAPSLGSEDSDDDNTFLLDPEQFVDELPQPFRLIDKFLYLFLDDVWNDIVAREKARVEYAKKIHPPIYSPSLILSKGVTCICHSGDVCFLFAALETGELVSYDAATHEIITQWSPAEVNACIEAMECVLIGPNVHLLATIDDMGFAKLIIFAVNNFFEVQVLNEQPEGNPKSNCMKFQLSKHGDFCGIGLECQDTAWLEFYKLPRDAWIQEIENAQRDSLKNAQISSESLNNSQTTDENIPAVASDTFDVKFSVAALAIKVNSPAPLTGTTITDHQEALEKAGIPNTVGDGSKHLFTEQHIEIRRAMTRHLCGESQTSQQTVKRSIPTWHFLLSSRMQPDLVVAPGSESIPVSVCVWWEGSYMAQTYLLLNKNMKDSEIKPDQVWPMTDLITSSCVSQCTNIIGFGFRNGMITIMDRHLCMPRAMSCIERRVPIQDMFILDGSIAVSTPVKTNPPPLFCLIGLSNGEVKLLNCSSNKCTTVVSKSDDIKEKHSVITPLLKLPQAFLWATTNHVRLQDTLTNHIICELAISPSLEPPKSRIFSSFESDVLYAKNEDGSLQIYHLRQFTSMDEYFRNQSVAHPLIVTETIAERCQQLLTEHVHSLEERTKSLSSRWHNWSKDLDVIKNFNSSQKPPQTPTTTPMSRRNYNAGKVMENNHNLTH
ncbi:WD repeat-containing protein 93-like [Clavelina lepadiformis]|uniref:WD repeat-containing protein 93-like n=1 Tax=Clavelina lepadiformis TaxID=159417 RepID=UPI004041CB16